MRLDPHISTMAVVVLCGWEGNRRSRIDRPSVTDSVVYQPTGSMASEREISTPALRS